MEETWGALWKRLGEQRALPSAHSMAGTAQSDEVSLQSALLIALAEIVEFGAYLHRLYLLPRAVGGPRDRYVRPLVVAT